MSNQSKPFKIVISDIDGTLITTGDPNSPDLGLKDVLERIRRKGILFSTISGRDLHFQRALLSNLFGPLQQRYGEAIIYEETCAVIEGIGLIEGPSIDRETLDAVNEMFVSHPEYFRGLVPLPDTNFTGRASWVTEEFASHRPTNKQVLDERYEGISHLITSKFPGVSVSRSADAIDAVRNGSSKSIGLVNYLNALKQHKFSPDIIAIGDSKNDESMFDEVLARGGRIAYVGTDIQLANKYKNHKNAYFSEHSGPAGTIEALSYLLLN